jgi:SAM-dependent methyltransferase
MRECSKAVARRLATPSFMTRYFRGRGVDIGGMPDPLSLYVELFPLLESVRVWDWDDGDAQFMEGVADDTFDFVHSSHCLEHLVDPVQGLATWLRVVKPGGYLIVTVPDEDLYEQGVFPSTFNRDHKWTFTVFKDKSWSDRSINVLDLLRGLGPAADIEKIDLLTSTYRYSIPRFDQTLTPVAECGIEFVVRKRHPEEVATGALKRPERAHDAALDKYMNQHVIDMAAMKAANVHAKPFTDETPLG